ncbi:deoxyribose-phosphate aldolase [Tenacibaculum sp. MAR_2009_124]|uniref:deoxyribose-phosphate aldolase n=1 Tax=Tenacibaculum sp. MAR_2009_124 TaxID=1250059 RepID=UPI0008964DEC|nr:deoxyribose-phosphate aldolase [Tenacibaculum sp. MAR_2009_124]SEB74664.1 deoxyribose-phosphate aldolase [Tenacibaculum sp. MAR_2009_124]
MKINQYIDHTNLKPTATKNDIIKLCNEAKDHNFYAVCVNGSHVKTAKKSLGTTSVKIAAVIGFPLGAMSTETKVFEAKQAVMDGADEIDMVIHIGKLLEGNHQYVETEISKIKKAIGNKVLKVILENCYLTSGLIKQASELAVNAKADFIKTSTGFGTGGATAEDILLMKEIVDNQIQIKAAGGIKDLKTAKKFIHFGASRLGTSSGVALATEGVSFKNEY